MFSAVSLHLIFFEAGSLTKYRTHIFGKYCCTGNSRYPPVSASPATGFQVPATIAGFLCGFCGPELRSSCSLQQALF